MLKYNSDQMIYSDKVKKVQQALGIKVDGWFGKQTHKAVVGFQRKKGLIVDGIVGPQTYKALFSSEEVIIEIDRTEMTNESTMGMLKVDGDLVGYTLELPWEDNKRRKSCILAGQYKAFIRDKSTSRWNYNVIQLRNVPNRNAIQIHRGNKISHTKGCILIGKTKGDNVVWQSKAAMDELMDKVKGCNKIIVKIK
ncbi:DUF5675 family protein [Halonatronum saccharophilum]|uniref:DUF5675 family protein n=1 Tax=Halonatronum saccharophilum TaxID=150060 RepID=UPI0004B8259F|nr:DUF5675 family protein [Halonatronum saccharophilum]